MSEINYNFSNQTLKLTNEFAKQYDDFVKNRIWNGPTTIFELLQNYVKPEDTLLDIGIGTGLVSVSFQKGGLKIYGIDGSEEMLKICQSKNITEKLIQTDLTLQEF